MEDVRHERDIPKDALAARLAHSLPKVDLHCHLVGTIQRSTVEDLVRRLGVRWPSPPAQIYADIRSLPPVDVDYSSTAVPMPAFSPGDRAGWSLLAVTELVEDLLRTRDDFVRVGYEAVIAAAAAGTRHLEVQVEVGAYLRRGVSYEDVLLGLDEGIAAAEGEVGTSALLIAAVDRSRSAAEGVQVVRHVAEHPHPRMVGIGLDNLETVGPPEKFAKAFELAARFGLRRTAHAGEHVPTAANVATCLETLACDRIDHGYFVLQDADLVKRCADEQVPFTCIGTTSRRSWIPWRRASIVRMIAAGMNVVISSDDPAMFPTDVTREYEALALQANLTASDVIAAGLRAVQASWLDSHSRAELERDYRLRADALLAELKGPK